MAQDFIIKKGHSSRLAQAELIENCWYLTTDTAEVFVALKQNNGTLELKKINECNIDTDLDLESFEGRIKKLEAERTHIYGYRKLFPLTGERDHFYIAEDEHRTYIWTNERYIHIADSFDYVDHDDNSDTPEVRIIYGGSAD